MKTLMIDEAHALFAQEHLRDELLEIDGVPNVRYLVRDDRVFVFERLVQLVRAARASRGNPPLDAALVASLMAQAWVSPADAIHDYGVSPAYYDLQSRDEGWVVVCKPLNAVLPGVYSTRHVGLLTLKELLVGKSVEDCPLWSKRSLLAQTQPFVFNGQLMRLEAPLDVGCLPKAPLARVEVNFDEQAVDAGNYDALAEPIVSQAAHKQIVAAYRRWQLIRPAVAAQVKAVNAWAALEQLGLSTLTLSEREAAQADEHLQELRAIYPELATLTNGQLLSLWEAYSDYDQPVRDESLALYLLGSAALGDADDDMDSYVEAGRWFLLAVGQGMSCQEAVMDAKLAHAHELAAGRMHWAALRVMHHVREAATLPAGQGLPIVTTQAMMRRMRRWNAAPVTVKQSPSDFGN